MTYPRASRLVAMTALAAATLIPAAAHGAAPTEVQPSPAAMTSLLTRTRMPETDPLALYTRLVRHQAQPISPLIIQATDYPIGQQRSFYIANETNNTYNLRGAHLLYKTAHAYWYVQDGVQVNMQGMQKAAQIFESKIYPTDRAAFGPERDPATDHDPHIVIFNGNTPGMGGYVSSQDLLPRSVFPYSNEGKVLYMQNGVSNPSDPVYLYTIAHEFQHLIHKHLHPEEDIWLNEGSSMLAQELNGYGVQGFDQAKASSGPLQLDAWSPSVGSDALYGGAYLWMLYLYEHFGGDRFTRAMLADRDLTGMPLIDDVLAKLGSREDSTAVFRDWVVADYLNDLHIDGGRYGYRASQTHAADTQKGAVPATITGAMPQYAASYIDLGNTGGAAFTLRFSGQPTVPLLNTTPPAPAFWWSNRGDNVDSTLTSPPIDLSRVSHATLRYQAWYDIEKDYDYAYVEASSDGGATWYSLPTTHTTTANPQGANRGNGYTGTSCTAAGHDRNCWVTEQADLSRFAGKRILLRWEMVTDESYDGQGLAVAHISIPEAGLSIDTGTPGWQPAGWVAASNTLAEHWLVTALVYGASGVQVVQMPVGDDGTGSLPIPAGATRVVVCVSPIAPKTTVASTFTVRAG